MGLFDKIPFSWRGDYEAYYKSKPDKPIKISTTPIPPKQETQSQKEPPSKIENLELLNQYQQHRVLLQQYSEKLKEREENILATEKSSLERIKNANDDLRTYSKALYELEYKIMDYVKRFERKELALFDEILNNVESFKKYAQTASGAGFDFEKEFSLALDRNGFIDVAVTQKSNDFGADILATKDGVSYVIQCKKYSSAVGIDAVQQAFAAKVHYNAHVAVVATNSVFSLSAKTLAKETGVLLWDGAKTNSMMQNQ